MAQGNLFPAFIKVETDTRAIDLLEGKLLSVAKKAPDEFGKAFGQVKDIIDGALSSTRNASGSLDLGVDQIKEAARASQARAIAAAEVTRATRASSAADSIGLAALEAYERETRQAAAADMERARAAELVQAELNKVRSATDAVIGASGRGTTAYQANTQSVRAMRQATTQAGQQLQDIVISMGSGQRASTVLAQQLPQLAFAFSDVGGKVGSVARFLAGPWGVAVAIGAFALGPLIDGLFQTEKASDSATKSNYDFASSFDVTKLAINEVAGAMAQLNQQTRSLIEGNKLLADSALVVANSSLKGLESQLSTVDAKIAAVQSRISNNSSGFGFGQLGNVPLGLELNKLKEQRGTLRASIGDARESVVNAELANSQLKVKEASDAGAKALGEYNREFRQLNKLREQGIRNEKDPMAAFDAELSGAQSISAAEYEKRLRVAQDRLEASKKRPDRGTAAREAARVEFGEDAGKRIANIADQFGEAPRLITQTNKALRELDDIQSDIERRKPKGVTELLSQIKDARGVIEDSLNRPLRELIEQSEEQAEIDQLLIGGRQLEAEILARSLDLQKQKGSLSKEDVETVGDIVIQERQRTEELRRQLAVQQRYQDVVSATYRSLEDLLSGGSGNDLLKSIRDQFKQLRGQNLAESLFGDAFAELRKFANRNNPENEAVANLVEQINNGSIAVASFANTLVKANAKITSVANDNSRSFPDAGFGSVAAAAAQAKAQENDAIVVLGRRNRSDFADFANATARAIFNPITQALDKTFGTNFFGQLSGVLTGALAGYARAGKVGGALGFGQGLFDTLSKNTKISAKASESLSKISGKFGQALGGAQTGDQTAQLLRSFGVKTSRTGGQIGGAIGSFLPIPGGQIIGSLIGSIGGGLFKKTKTGTLVLNSASGDVRTSGKLGSELKGAGNSIQDQLKSIADQLGGSVGNFAVSIGKRGDYFRVSGSGATNVDTKKTKNINNLIYDGKDEAEATRIALFNAIQDGAILGINQGSQRLLQAGKDMSAQLQKALKFQSVFDRLDAIKDPVGSAIRSLNKEFTGLIGIFNEAGASAQEFAQLEELYGLERAKTIKEASESLTGSLKSLISDLTKGDSGLSLRDRLSNIRADFNPMADTIRRGGKVDYDKFSELSRQLIEVQREISGSQTDYFSTFDEVLGLSRQALAGQENVVSMGSNTASPFSGNAAPSNASVPVVSAINAQTGELMSGFAALTAQVAKLQVASFGGGRQAMLNPNIDYF